MRKMVAAATALRRECAGGTRFYRRRRIAIMQVYEELVARGLIAQVTNEEEIKKMVNEGKAVFLYRL